MKLNHIAVAASIKKHPLIWFYVISVLIEIAIIPVFYLTGAADTLMSAIETSGIPFKTDLVTAFRVVLAVPSAFPGVFLAIVQLAAVDIAVFIVARIAFGPAGIADLKARFRFWKKAIPYQRALKIWGVCIVTFSLINFAAAGLNKLMFPGFFVWDVNFSPVHFLVSLAITLFLDIGGLFEENGWRGFALPLLLQRFSPLKATLVLGFLWGFWHFPVKYDLFHTFGLVGGFVYLSAFTLRLTFVSILMTYFWNRLGQTTIVAIAMHGLINDSIGLGGRIESESFIPQLFTEVNLLIPTAIVAILLIVKTRGRLGIRVNN
ncbi:MAG: CPBP family intramembrane metalloprotease [Leptolyngbyaceae cyanobacterium RM2_2_4]|nr:CPBP family intramembrane metalloprotease [Leptolyngbyaceae cyanobacterium SM1_4_3]NJN89249.1 CPBP family intramembrane metalloprotease [Leptolyngbyaceae cyanobacterium SL_5_14]NJO51622.1 CPBP family intramembrane metalloprotease [Leptolyngbyaceae cyanobacterium RM2_2_4]NJO66320.1 CPBP family intramembrane metalloprotease [Leptolyngbyaceae cyanobacterium RM1_405_57]